MSEFKCEVVKVDDVIKHPNADRLTIVKIKGFNCISNLKEDGSRRYNPGDLVVYIPEAAVVPDWLLQKMGFWDQGMGTLSGSRKNRVKIVKLRGEYSQGIMMPVVFYKGMDRKYDKHFVIGRDHNEEEKVMFAGLETSGHFSMMVKEGDDVSEFLGITKYEPAIPAQMAGKQGNLFGYTKSYDIESLQNYPNTFEEGEEVVVTEKLHGTQCSVGFLYEPPEGKDEELFEVNGKKCAYASSKGLSKKGLVQKNSDENQGNLYVKTYKAFFEGERANSIMAESLDPNLTIDMKKLIVYGEIFGPGTGGFNYNQKEHTFRVFDAYIEYVDKGTGNEVKEYLNNDGLDAFCDEYKLERVPVLYVGPYSKEKMIELRDGQSTFGGNIREGIVIRPTKESYESRGLSENRKQVKFVSPAYKLQEDDENAIT